MEPASISLPGARASPEVSVRRSSVPFAALALNSSLVTPSMRLSSSSRARALSSVSPANEGTLTGLGPSDTMSVTSVPLSTFSPEPGDVPFTVPADRTRSNSSSGVADTTNSAATRVVVALLTLIPETSGTVVIAPGPFAHHNAAPPPPPMTTTRMKALIHAHCDPPRLRRRATGS